MKIPRDRGPREMYRTNQIRLLTQARLRSGENLKKKRQKAREKKTTYVNSSVKGQRN